MVCGLFCMLEFALCFGYMQKEDDRGSVRGAYNKEERCGMYVLER